MTFEVPSRRAIDDFEVAYLSVLTCVAIVFNSLLLAQLLTSSKQPTVRTSFSTGPYQFSSFSLFKINLCISDFCILLIYSLGKIIWLITYDWRLGGDTGCRLYQFLSALSFYASSNIIVAIGLDRLKVVYIRHLQGATSVRRVRLMVVGSWLLAAICSIPQAIFWKTVEVEEGWHQCVTVFQYHELTNTSTPTLRQIALIYEFSHQATVFWIPFLIILICYLMIVLKLLCYHTLKNREPMMRNKPSESDNREKLSLQESMLVPLSPRRKWSAFTFLSNSLEVSTSEYRSNSMGGPSPGKFLQRMGSVPAWRRQLRSRIFRSALAVVLAHVAMWLPYNAISTLRFINYDMYTFCMAHGGNFIEDLIVLNSLLNPLLYGNPFKKR